MTTTYRTDAIGQPLDGIVRRSVSSQRHQAPPPIYRGSADADEVRQSCAELLDNYATASTVLPVSAIAGPILDLIAASAHSDPGRRGDAMRRFMADLQAELADAHECLQRAHAARAARPAPVRALIA